MTDETILIRSYEFEGGTLHLDRGACTDEEVAGLHWAKGKLLSARDGEMPASEFFALPDFDDL